MKTIKTKRSKIILTIAILALLMLAAIRVVLPTNATTGNWQEGDIVFQISKSGQSPFVSLATQSPYTHCGMVVEKDSQWYVLEAHNGVELTPLKEWCDRGVFKRMKRRGYFTYPVKVRYGKYLGKRYDFQFSFCNDRYYCSELVLIGALYAIKPNIRVCAK